MRPAGNRGKSIKGIVAKLPVVIQLIEKLQGFLFCSGGLVIGHIQLKPLQHFDIAVYGFGRGFPYFPS